MTATTTTTSPAHPAEAFARTAQEFADHPFLHIPATAMEAYGQGVVDWRYGEAAGAVEVLAERYRDAGFGRGHRVGLALDNRAEFFLHFLALNGLGASVVPLNAAMQVGELGHVMAHSDLAVAVCLRNYVKVLEAAAKQSDRAIPVVPVSASEPFDLTVSAPADRPAGDGSEAALLYTSGTTGKPKGCILSNTYFLAVGRCYLGLGGYCSVTRGSERLATPLPVSHMNALCVSFMAMVMSGGCLVQLDRFHPSTWWQTIGDSAATIVHYLGVMPAILLNRPARANDDFSSQVKFGFGAGVDPKHHRAFEQRFGFPLIEAWSMTETGAGAWITANTEPRHVGQRCFGRAPESVAVRIVDEAGAECPADQPGELLVRQAGDDPRARFFSGYYKDRQATEAAWAGGWFHTGDVVRQDVAGSFFFVDRIKNVIRRSGENIAAVEVESALMEHPAVAGVAVAPVPDDIRGEEVMALIVLHAETGEEETGASLAREVADHVRGRLSYFKAPGYIAFVDHLPLTASEKVQRRAVKERCRALVDAGEAFDLRAAKRRPARRSPPT